MGTTLIDQANNRSSEEVLAELLNQLYGGTITESELLQKVRKNVLKLSQSEYAKLTGLSRRTISAFEQKQVSLSLTAYRALFKPIGLQPGLLPRRTIDGVIPTAY
jgi:DNA-binding XRE family transcriptional regulator